MESIEYESTEPEADQFEEGGVTECNDGTAIDAIAYVTPPPSPAPLESSSPDVPMFGPPRLEPLDGRYVLGQPIGRGGMGWVFDGHDRRLQRPVAVKVMRSELAGELLLSQRFEREALAASRLNSPHVVVVHDFGDVEGTPYLVMERLVGESLSARLRRERGGLGLTESVDIALDIARALAALEAAGIVHRDLKPANLFITTAGPTKLLDFGVAKISEVPELSHALNLTSTGMLIGTPTT